MGSKHSGCNLQWEGGYLELQLLRRSEAFLALNEGGGKGARKRLYRIVTVDEMQFEFMPERGTIDSVFILRRLLKATRIPLFLITHSNTLFGSVKSFPQVKKNIYNFFHLV